MTYGTREMVTYDIRHIATCQALKTQGAKVILENTGVTSLVAAGVYQTASLRSENKGAFIIEGDTVESS